MANTVNGTVKWFSARRGYGFISDAEGVDYFAHFSQIKQDGFRKLSSGQPVMFEVGEDGNGRTGSRSRDARVRSLPDFDGNVVWQDHTIFTHPFEE